MSSYVYVALLFLCTGVASDVSGDVSKCGVADIVLLVDGSKSIGKTNFEKLKFQIANYVQQLPIGNGGTRIGMILYSTTVQASNVISLSWDAQSLISLIIKLRYPQQGTLTNLAIDRGLDLIKLEGRQGIPHKLVVVTDGVSNLPAKTQVSANKAKALGIRMFALGVGNGVYEDELYGLASGPKNVRQSTDFDSVLQSLSEFNLTSCETTQTVIVNTPAVRTESILSTDICNKCKFQNGVGFEPHPVDCRMFIQCSQGINGLKPIALNCPDRLFWYQDAKTCVEFYNSDCNKGECAIGSSYLFKSINNCGLYFNCTGNVITHHCCDHNRPQFDETTGSCVPSSDCGRCDITRERIIKKCKSNIWRQHIDENGNVDPCYYDVIELSKNSTMACASGTIFSEETCSCSIFSDQCIKVDSRAICQADLWLPFKNDEIKDEQNGAWIGRKRVQVLNNEAIFDGKEKSRLYINRYSNNDFALPLVIKVIYKDTASQPNMAVLTTGGCINKPSLYITAGNGQASLGVVTVRGGYNTTITSHTSTTSTNSWKEVKMLFDGTQLIGEVTDLNDNLTPRSSPKSFPTKDVPGGSDRILRVDGALQLGYAHEDTFPGFQGSITELKIWSGCTQQLAISQFS